MCYRESIGGIIDKYRRVLGRNHCRALWGTARVGDLSVGNVEAVERTHCLG